MSEPIPSLVVTTNLLSSTTNTVTPDQEMSATIQPPADVQSLEAQNSLLTFWQDQTSEVQNMNVNEFKVQELPLARIKKIMKMDEDVKMISAEAPLLFAKAAQMFIAELSLRAWVHTEENKRRTLQRNDIATAIAKFDQFDFLIDIVPREELKPPRREDAKAGGDNFQCFYNVPQQTTQTNVSNLNTSQVSSPQAHQTMLTSGGQILQINQGGQSMNGDLPQQVVQLAQPQQNRSEPRQASNGQTTTSIQQPDNVLNTQTDNQTTLTPQLIQQLVNSSGASPSEILSIQITADGQVQIVKAANSSSENL